jgi:DNA-binding XRE family transcriptional regulator
MKCAKYETGGANDMNAVKYYRIKSGLSQRDLDRRAGIHSVLMMENTDPNSAAAHISSEDYNAISSVLGVSVDELYRTDLPTIVET